MCITVPMASSQDRWFSTTNFQSNCQSKISIVSLDQDLEEGHLQLPFLIPEICELFTMADVIHHCLVGGQAFWFVYMYLLHYFCCLLTSCLGWYTFGVTICIPSFISDVLVWIELIRTCTYEALHVPKGKQYLLFAFLIITDITYTNTSSDFNPTLHDQLPHFLLSNALHIKGRHANVPLISLFSPCLCKTSCKANCLLQ